MESKIEFERLFFELAVESGYYALAKRIADDRNAMRRQPGAVLLARSIEALRIDKYKRRALIRWFIQKEVQDKLHAQSLDRQKNEQKLLKKVAIHIGNDGAHTRRRSNMKRRSQISLGDSNHSNSLTPLNKKPGSGSPSRRPSNSLVPPGGEKYLPPISVFTKNLNQIHQLRVQSIGLQSPDWQKKEMETFNPSEMEENNTEKFSATIIIPVPGKRSKQGGKQLPATPQQVKNLKTDAPTETHEDNSDQSMTLTNTLRQEFSHPRFLTLNSHRKKGRNGHFLNASPQKNGKQYSSELELPSMKKAFDGSNLGDDSSLGIEIRNYDHPDFYPKPKELDFLDVHMEKRVERTIEQESQRNKQQMPKSFQT